MGAGNGFRSGLSIALTIVTTATRGPPRVRAWSPDALRGDHGQLCPCPSPRSEARPHRSTSRPRAQAPVRHVKRQARFPAGQE